MCILNAVVTVAAVVSLIGCGTPRQAVVPMSPSDSAAIVREAGDVIRHSFALNSARKFNESFQWFTPATTGAADGQLILNWQEHRDRNVRPFLARLDSMTFSLGDVVVTPITSEVAVLVAKYSFSGVLDGRRLSNPSTAVTWVLSKRNGRWEIVHWHTSNP